MEGIVRAAAEALGLRESRDEIEELDDGAGPAVRDQQRGRVGMRRARMDEVQVQPVELEAELRQGVDALDGGRPVETMAPVRKQLAQRVAAEAVGLLVVVDLVGKARAVQARMKVRDGGAVGVEAKG